MTFPVVESTATSSVGTASTTHAVSLPSGIQAGDLLIVIGGGATAPLIAPSGWTAWANTDIAFVKKADGTEGASINFTTSVSTISAHNSYRISNWGSVAIAQDSGDPPGVAVPWEGEDVLWIAALLLGSTTSGDKITAAPTNYSNLIESGNVGSGSDWIQCGSARRNLNATTEDPGSFTFSGGDNLDIQITIGIRPNIANAISSITKHADATSTSSSVTGPATIQAGDLLVLADKAINSSGAPTEVVPTDFVSIFSDFASTLRLVLSAKIADGSEASSSITGMNGTSSNDKVLIVYRPNTPAESMFIRELNADIGTSNPQTVAVSSAFGETPLVVVAAYGASGAVSPRTMTPAKDGEIGTAGTDLWQAWKIYNSNPQNVTADMDDEGTNAIALCWIGLFTAVGGGGGGQAARSMHQYRQRRI